MRINHIIAVLIGLLLAAIGSSTVSIADAVSAGQEKQPQVYFPETRHDFGSVMEGREIRHEFTIENHGRAPLAILRVQPD
jgi:hypothetical protein